MKLKVLLLAAVLAPLALTACSKQDKAAATDAQSASDVATSTADQTTAEQQAAIDALDQPILDENNTDVPAEKANAPADVATPADDADTAAH